MGCCNQREDLLKYSCSLSNKDSTITNIHKTATMEREDKKSVDVFIESKQNSKSRNDRQSLIGTFNSSTIKFEPKVDNEQCVIPKSQTVIFIPKLNMNKINVNEDKPHVISYDKYKYIFEDVEPSFTSSTKRNGSRSKRLRELKQRSNQNLSLFEHNKHK